MKAMCVIGIVVASFGLLFGLTAMGTLVADVDTMVGYGFFAFVFSGYALALAIVALKRKAGKW